MIPFTNQSNYDLLFDLFQKFVAGASPKNCLPQYLDQIQHQKIYVCGAGKAAASMAHVVEQHFAGQITGTVITRYGHRVKCKFIDVIEASHPIPDQTGLQAAQHIVDSVRNLGDEALVVCLISGGASALMSLPIDSLSLQQKRSITQTLLKAGATIEEINTVRKHLSAIKGGNLMAAIYPASALSFCISDVVGDSPSVIGSGPTVGDPSTCSEVLSIAQKYQLQLPKIIQHKLLLNQLETPKPNSNIFKNSKVFVVAKPSDCLVTVKQAAESYGFKVFNLGDAITADTNQTAVSQAKFIKKLIFSRSISKPFLVISGGETTVKVSGFGKGGPNTQFILALAIELQNINAISAMACDSDGIDGTQDNAGAYFDAATLQKAKALNLDPNVYLKNNDSYSFFEKIGGLVKCGPTLTNVNDLRLICVDPAKN